MLNYLVDYAQQNNLAAEAGFTPKTARAGLVFDKNGRFKKAIDWRDSSDKKSRGRNFTNAPHLKFSGDTPMRQFLIDTAQYAVLYEQAKPPEKLIKKHEFFVNLLREAGAADPIFKVLADALSKPDTLKKIHADLDTKQPKIKPADNLTFVISDDKKDRILIEEDCWRNWWRDFFPTLFAKKKGKDDQPMRCLITGQLTEPARTHPKIKGLGGVGGKVETTLVGFNQASFCSFGLDQSLNAAVSEQAAQQYAAALNHLIEHNSETVAGTKVAYWYVGETEVPKTDDIFRELFDGIDLGEAEESEDKSDKTKEYEAKRAQAQAESKASKLLKAIRTGQRPDLASARYNALTLSGNSARVVIRDWMEGQFEELAENITKWFSDLAIIKLDEPALGRSPKFIAILAGLVRDLRDITAPTVAHLWKTSIHNKPIPRHIAAQALSRIVIDTIQDNPPRLARLGLLKAYVIRMRTKKYPNGDMHMQPFLNENHPDPAYHCGRLLAVAAYIQYKALGDVGAGVIERYYASASATPAIVFGRVMRNAQFHLNKIDNKKIRLGLDNRLAEVWARIKDSIPNTLTLEEQSLFALGYYHQKAYRGPAKENDDQNS